MPAAVRTVPRTSVLTINAIAVPSHTITMSLDKTREEITTIAWETTYKDVGALVSGGTITVIYDETANSPYEILRAELDTPTAGGIPVVYQKKGAGSGTNKEETFNIVVLNESETNDANTVYTSEFTFGVTDDITRATQS